MCIRDRVRAAAVGHVAAANPRERHSVLELRSARVPGYVENVDLTLGAGEILALYGRLGCGAVELAEALFGLRSLNGDIVLLAGAVSYTHLRAHETVLDIVCRLLLEKQKHNNNNNNHASYASHLESQKLPH